MTPPIGWAEIGDLQMDETGGVLSRNPLDAILAVICAHLGERAGAVLAPCANANRAPPEHDRQIVHGLAPPHAPSHMILGDRKFQSVHLAHGETACSRGDRPEVAVSSGHWRFDRDVVSTGTGAPHSRLTMRPRNGLMAKPAREKAEGHAPFVFIEAYPSELDAGGDTIARTFADARVIVSNKTGMRR
jgi:hypothetical protein